MDRLNSKNRAKTTQALKQTYTLQDNQNYKKKQVMTM